MPSTVRFTRETPLSLDELREVVKERGRLVSSWFDRITPDRLELRPLIWQQSKFEPFHSLSSQSLFDGPSLAAPKTFWRLHQGVFGHYSLTEPEPFTAPQDTARYFWGLLRDGSWRQLTLVTQGVDTIGCETWGNLVSDEQSDLTFISTEEMAFAVLNQLMDFLEGHTKRTEQRAHELREDVERCNRISQVIESLHTTPSRTARLRTALHHLAPPVF